MKYLIAVIALAVFLFTFAAPVMAQELPDTAVGALEQVGIVLMALGAAAAGYLGFTATDFLKQFIPEAVAEKVGDWLFRVISMATSSLSGLLVELLMDYAIQLDDTGLWKAIITIFLVVGAPVAAELFHRARKATA